MLLNAKKPKQQMLLKVMTNSNDSLSTIVGDEKLTSREDRIGPLFMYVQCDEDTMGARVIGPELAFRIADTFLDSKFSNDERHIRRISMLED